MRAARGVRQPPLGMALRRIEGGSRRLSAMHHPPDTERVIDDVVGGWRASWRAASAKSALRNEPRVGQARELAFHGGAHAEEGVDAAKLCSARSMTGRKISEEEVVIRSPRWVRSATTGRVGFTCP